LADLEDSNATWKNAIEGQQNLMMPIKNDFS
jgi:hypothetical protein